MTDSPCYDCKKRTVYCHSLCEEYTKWRMENDKARKNRQELERLERWRKGKW